jgi:FkbM family methyltransferase
MKLLNNLRTIISRPQFAVEYADYCGSTLRHGRARKVLPGGITISNFSGFSEFHSVRDFVNQSERAFFTSFPFSCGDIFDIGANLGVISLMIARNPRIQRIFAFEPNPSTFEALRDNMQLNNAASINIEQAAVSDVDGTIPFAADAVRRGTASIAPTVQSASKVPSVRLDTFIKERGVEQVALLKVDVEGYESAVFAGAREALEKRLIPIVYYEVCPAITRHAGFDPLSPTLTLQEHGYQIFALKNGNVLERVDPVAEIGAVTCENWIGLLPAQVVGAGQWIP